jgi:hypothetical protein
VAVRDPAAPSQLQASSLTRLPATRVLAARSHGGSAGWRRELGVGSWVGDCVLVGTPEGRIFQVSFFTKHRRPRKNPTMAWDSGGDTRRNKGGNSSVNKIGRSSTISKGQELIEGRTHKLAPPHCLHLHCQKNFGKEKMKTSFPLFALLFDLERFIFCKISHIDLEGASVV